MAKTKLIYIIGSAVIGLIAVLGVFFGLMAGGAIDASVTRISIASLDAAKEYDGTALVKNEWTLLAGKLKEGHVIQAAFSGSQTDAGKSENTFSALVLDEGGADVTDHYDLDLQFGTLAVETKYVEYQAPSGEKVYDGTALTVEGFEIVSGGLVEGHTTESSVYGERTNVGEAETSLTVVIKDGNGVDVSHNYRIALNKGGLKVTAKPVTILSADDEKVYDGKPLENIKCEVDGETPLVEGHILEAEADGSITDVGTQKNDFTPTIKDASGEDVTANYAITKKAGTLKIDKRFLTLRSNDGTNEYNGTAFKVENYTVVSGTVADEQKVVPYYTGAQTDVGSSENAYSAQIFTSDGEKETTDNYMLTLATGTLTVTPKPLEITSAGDTKIYDGTPLTVKSYSITNGSLVSGQREVIRWNDSAQTNVGECENEYTCEIYAENDQLVTQNYKITLKNGKLEVTKRPITITSKSATEIYSGRPLTAGYESGTPAPNQRVVVNVTGSQTDAGTSANTFDYEIYASDGVTSVKDNYDVTLSVGMLEVTKRTVSVTVQNYAKEYDGTPLYGQKAPWNSVGTVADHEYGIFHTVEFTSETELTDVGSTALVFSCIVTDGNGNDVTKNYELNCSKGATLEVTPKAITVVSDSDYKTYDGTPLTREELVTNESVLVLGHTFEPTFTGEQTKAGKSENKFTVIVTDGYQDRTKNYQITYKYGTLEVFKRAASVEVKNSEKVYDGLPLYGQDTERTPKNLADGHTLNFLSETERTNAGSTALVYTCRVLDGNGEDVTENYDLTCTEGVQLVVLRKAITVVSDGGDKTYDGKPLMREELVTDESVLVAGHTLNPTFTGTQTKAGKSENTFTVAIKNGFVDVTPNYQITYKYGTLEVFKREAFVVVKNSEKVYDGLPLYGQNTIRTSQNLADGHTLKFLSETERTNAGSTALVYTCRILDGNGEDVTENYDLTCSEGVQLVVLRKAITVVSDSDYKTYDGTPLTKKELLTDESVLVAGHTFKPTFTGTQTNAGKSENKFTVMVTNGYQDQTGNYEITYKYGTLEVFKREATVVSGDFEKIYDGELYFGEEAGITPFNLVDQHSPELLGAGKYVNAGTHENKFTCRILDENGVDVTGNYALGYVYGTVEIRKREAMVVSGDFEKVYDGELYFGEDAGITPFNLVDGHISELLGAGRYVNAGTHENHFTCRITSDGVDVTDNYVLGYVYGTVEIKKRTATVSTGDLGKIYDGEPLDGNLADFSSQNLVDGHTAVLQDAYSVINAGVYENKFICYITSDGEDVTANYELQYHYGTLTVTPRPLVAWSEGTSKEYDGTSLTHNKVHCDEAALVSGHTFEGRAFGTITDWSEKGANNVFSYTIEDENGDDVTANYEVETNEGTLMINKRTIRIRTNGKYFTYDGTEHSHDSWDFVGEKKPIDGHTFDAVLLSSIKDRGSVKNAVDDWSVVDGYGVDVSNNYQLEAVENELVVERRSITVRSASDTKIYDGTPLTNDHWEVTSTYTVIEELGEYLKVTVSGTRTDVGESRNTIAEVLVFNAEDEDITYNYQIKEELGYLLVTDDGNGGGSGSGEDGSGSGSGNGSGSGEDGNGSGSGNGNGSGASGLSTDGNLGLGDRDGDDDTVILKVYSEKSGAVFLRFISHGDYLLNSWGKGKEYDGLLDGKYSMNYLTSLTLQNAGQTAYDMKIDSLQASYLLPYYTKAAEGQYAVQTSDVCYAGDSTSIYAMTYYPYDYIADGGLALVAGLPSAYTAAEAAYRSFVYENYTALPDSTLAYMQTLIAQKGFGNIANQYELIAAVKSYIQSAAVYSLKYDRALDDEPDVVVAFLETYKTGICQHYASSATALYRALGIPARYVGGFSVKTAAGTWVEVAAKQAHAWVEVYLDGVGWIPVEVTGGIALPLPEDPDIESQKLVVTPQTQYLKYDGHSTLTADPNKISGLTHLTSQGYTFKATVFGSRSAIGFGTSEITSFTLYDPNGNDVTDEYEITFNKGVLHVYATELFLTSGGGSKVYDGVPLLVEDCTFDGELLDGHRFGVLKLTGSQTDVGSSSNAISIQIVDENGKDVTYMYKINKSYGTLTVTAATITVTADSASKTYDSAPLVCGTYTVTGELPTGHTLEVVVTGSQTNVGRSKNKVTSVVVRDALGNDVSKNFTIETVNGLLTVTPAV